MGPLQFGTTGLLVALVLVTVGVPVALFAYLFYRLGWPAAGESVKVSENDTQGLDDSLRRTVDWAVVVTLALVGVSGTLAGVFVLDFGDRDHIAGLVADGVIESDIFSEATLVELAHTVVVWGGFGLVATGLLFVLAALVFAGDRLRLDRRLAAGVDARPSIASNALVGAVVTVATSFVPLSPLLGGAVAGYLQGEDPQTGIRVGILAGLFVAVPVVVVFGSIAVGLLAAGLLGTGSGLLVGLLLTLVVELALSTVGGFAGGYLGRPDE